MSRLRRADRWLVGCLAIAALASGCRSAPRATLFLSPKSSLLAVDVVFPTPLGRDPSLVQAFLVKGPIHGGVEELPELLPATFVKRSRAYWLDPEPGTYSLVAVTAAVAAPLRDGPVAGGVARTTLMDTIAEATILPERLIRRTRTSIGAGDVAFIGALEIAPGERINADAAFQDLLQRRLAERLRPGASSESGLAGWFTLARMPDLEHSSLRDDAEARETFLGQARGDLDPSPWAEVVARAMPPDTRDTLDSLEALGSLDAGDAGDANAADDAAAAETLAPAARPPAMPPGVVAARPRQQPAAPKAPRPVRRRVPGIPADSPLAKIEIGMGFDEVQRILGDPDDRIDRTTAKAWIPFYTGPGAYLREWIYAGRGRVVFSLHGGSLEVLDVVYDPHQRR